jgi:hypothetical protein
MATAGLVVVGLAYWILALPVTANALLDQLPAPPVTSVDGLTAIDTLFILDGDNRRGRARHAAAIVRRWPAMDAWLLGPSYMLDDLMFAGFPPALLRQEDRGYNTQTQIAEVKRITERRVGRVGLLASRVSIPRIARFVRAENLDVVLVAAPLDEEPSVRGVWMYLPSLGALTASRDAIYEIGALRYYRERPVDSSGPRTTPEAN